MDQELRNYSAYSETMMSHALGRIAGSRRTQLHMQRTVRTSPWPPSSKYDVIPKIRLRTSMRIFLKNNPVTFNCV